MAVEFCKENKIQKKHIASYIAIYVFPRRHAYITSTCRQLMNMEIYNNIDQLCYARETRTPGKHISMHGMHAASRCIHAEIVHCWLYSYIQSFNHAYSYGTPIRVWDSTMSHTRMGRYTHMGQNRCTTPKTHLSVQRPKLRTLMQTAFSTPAVWICEAP